MPSAGSGRSAYLAAVQRAEVDATAAVSTNKLAAGAGVYANLQVRRASGTSMYTGRIRILDSGAIRVAATRLSGSTTEQVIGPEVGVTGLTYQAGTRLHVRLRVTGANPTRIQVKSWPAGSAEQVGWNVDVTDATASLQQPGALGVRTYVSGSATTAPITVSFDDLVARAVGS